MSDVFKLAGILALVTLIAAGALSAVNSVTAPVIKAYMIAEETRAREQVLPEAEAHHNLAVVARAIGDTDRAAAEFRKAADLLPVQEGPPEPESAGHAETKG